VGKSVATLKGLRGICLGLWGGLLLFSYSSERLNLLVRAPLQPVIGLAGVVLLLLAGLDMRLGQGRQRLPRRESAGWLLGGMVAVAMLLLPPEPSFSDLAATRGSGQMLQEEISFVLPAGQRSVTDWVRLLRAAPDPQLYDGDPVRISGFVLAVPGQPPQLARLLVRCCLADATPIGLPVRWPPGKPLPKANQWLEIEGVMGIDSSDGQAHSLVLPRRISPIPRPKRPFEG
jgi:uncharacterized repeat protein (TIGR03943 family)